MLHIIFDIETVPALSCRNDEALALIQRRRLESKYKKPETIESHMADFVRGMSLEPGLAQVCAISAKCFDTSLAVSIATDDEEGLLIDFRAWLALADENRSATLVGFNIRKFDIPVLVAAYMRRGLHIPPVLTRALLEPYRWTIDYCALFPGAALQRFSQALGLEPLAVSGADVAELFEEHDFDAISRHCWDDVRMIEMIHERVHG
jgi:hypothetical protein